MPGKNLVVFLGAVPQEQTGFRNVPDPLFLRDGCGGELGQRGRGNRIARPEIIQEEEGGHQDQQQKRQKGHAELFTHVSHNPRPPLRPVPGFPGSCPKKRERRALRV